MNMSQIGEPSVMAEIFKDCLVGIQAKNPPMTSIIDTSLLLDRGLDSRCCSRLLFKQFYKAVQQEIW
jgi:hypothetical protein